MSRKAETKVLVHILRGLSSVNQGHRHPFRTFARRTIFTRGSHFHTFTGVTGRVAGHVHRFRGRTGLAIPLSGGNHIHRFHVITFRARGHRHVLSGTTSPVVDI